MCGIAGYTGSQYPDDERVASALALMVRRGPDHQASARFLHGQRHAALLHARLSIIDLDPRANQPFRRGEKVIVYNGELYNYVELRDELARLGHIFTTRSDTEVLLAVLEAWGWQGLDRCEGMWAFALWDEADGSLTLCRDRFGEKPLYVLDDEQGGLCFASEIKAAIALRGTCPRIDETQLLRYLVNGYKALNKQSASFYHGVEPVPPGSILRVDARGRRQCWRYWTPDLDPEQSLSWDEAVAGIRSRLIRAVEMRLRADVPLAFCMSGGVDSNALIAIAKRICGYDVHGFTILNTDSRYEEKEFVDAAVSELGLRHTGIPLSTANFLPNLARQVRHHDAPVATISYYVHSLLMEAMAADRYRISISGTAADELFSGYYDHQNLYLAAIHDEPALYRRALTDWQSHVAPIVRNPFLQDPEVFIKRPGERRHIYLDSHVLAANLRRPWAEPFTEAVFRPGLLRNRMLNELFHESVPVILAEDDSNAMYHSIENRSPFLDRDLFEFTLRIPDRFLVRDGRAKAVLREAMRGIAPQAVLDNRRKVGFNAPIAELLNMRDPKVRKVLLDDSPIFDLVDPDRVIPLLDQPNLANSRSKFLFSFVSAKLFLDNPDPASLPQ